MAGSAVQASDTAKGFDLLMRPAEEKELLRISTAGSVDDGKSTLIGRLLYDSKGVYEDHLASIRKPNLAGDEAPLDFALLTDGLRAEREQGITIDVAYRYFATPKRKFIIADTPGHEQYTRNMATGASTANVAVILVDARKGVLAQSRRHAFIASLLGTPHVVVTVNKMDLVGFRQEVFDAICAQFSDFAAGLRIPDLHFIPISALDGDNVAQKSARMPWFGGDSLLHHLETVHIAGDRNLSEMRFPVQYVLRPNSQFRGYAGQVASGIIQTGDTVMILPSCQTSKVKSIVTYDGELPRAIASMSVAVCLEDEVDISRGDMLVHPSHPPRVANNVDARIIWMSATPLDLRRTYLLKQTTRRVKVDVRQIRYRVDVNSLEKGPATELRLNDIGAVVLHTHQPIFVDPYRRNPATGSAIIIDPGSNETVAACMITAREPVEAVRALAAAPEGSERRIRFGHGPLIVWMPPGEHQVAAALARALGQRGCAAYAVTQDVPVDLLPQLVRGYTHAGLLTVLTVPSAAEHLRGEIQALADGEWIDVDASLLSNAVAESVEAIVRVLEREGLIRI